MIVPSSAFPVAMASSHGVTGTQYLASFVLLVVGLLTPTLATGAGESSFGLQLRASSSSLRGLSQAQEATHLAIDSLQGASPAFAAGREYDKAWDGDTSTYYDFHSASGGWTQATLKEPTTIHRIKYWPRLGWNDRMQGGIFYGIQASGGEEVLCTVANHPPSNQWSECTSIYAGVISAVKYSGPAGSYGNVAEIELYGASRQPARKKKHGVDVYYIIEMLDKFRTYSVEHQALSDHSHLLEQERLENQMEVVDDSGDKSLLEGAATRNEESRLESQNAFNEMINFVSTLKQAMGAKGNAPTCEELTCGMHSKCETTVEKGALCNCEDGYEGDGFICKPPVQFTAMRLIPRENPAPQVADLHMTVFMGDRVAVVYRDISQGEKGYFMLGRIGVGDVQWNPPRLFSNMSRAYSPVVAGLPNGRVAIAYRDAAEAGAGVVLGAEVDVKENKMFFGKQEAFARHQSHAMSLVALPNSRVAVMFADRDMGNNLAPYGAALLTQIGEGGVPELLGRYRFVNAPVTRFSSALLTSNTFVVGYRQGEADGAAPTSGKAEASVIWAQMRGSELIFDPHPLSLEPEKTQIWSRGVALVAKDTFAYAYYSGNEQVSKQAIIKVDPSTHAMTILDGPNLVAKGNTPFVGTVSMPFAPRAPHTFTYYSRTGSGYARAQTCNVNPVGLMQHCQDLSWSGYEMESVAGVGLGHGKLLFAFTDPAGTPYYQFVSLFEEDAPADPMEAEG